MPFLELQDISLCRKLVPFCLFSSTPVNAPCQSGPCSQGAVPSWMNCFIIAAQTPWMWPCYVVPATQTATTGASSALPVACHKLRYCTWLTGVLFCCTTVRLPFIINSAGVVAFHFSLFSMGQKEMDGMLACLLAWFLVPNGVGRQRVTEHAAPTSAAGSEQKAQTCWLLEDLCTAEVLCGRAPSQKPLLWTKAVSSSCSARLLLLDDQLRHLREHVRDSPQSPRTPQAQPPSLRLQRGLGSKTIHFVST